MRTPGPRCGSTGCGWVRVDPTAVIDPDPHSTSDLRRDAGRAESALLRSSSRAARLACSRHAAGLAGRRMPGGRMSSSISTASKQLNLLGRHGLQGARLSDADRVARRRRHALAVVSGLARTRHARTAGRTMRSVAAGADSSARCAAAPARVHRMKGPIAYGERIAARAAGAAATVRAADAPVCAAALRPPSAALAERCDVRPRACACSRAAAASSHAGTRDSNHAPTTKNSVSTRIDSR